MVQKRTGYLAREMIEITPEEIAQVMRNEEIVALLKQTPSQKITNPGATQSVFFQQQTKKLASNNDSTDKSLSSSR